MEFTKSKRGSDILFIDNYKFWRNKSWNDVVYWNCSTNGYKFYVCACVSMKRASIDAFNRASFKRASMKRVSVKRTSVKCVSVKRAAPLVSCGASDL